MIDQAADALAERCRSLLLEIGYIERNTPVRAQLLTGGVASDIALVSVGNTKVVVKFALPKLRVETPWFAPVHRNAAEFAWLGFVNSIAPDNAVPLLGKSEQLHGFAMAYLHGDTYLWKTALLEETVDGYESAAVGGLLGHIHKASINPTIDTAPFENQDDFYALRIEPYLTYTATQHPDIAEPILAMANGLRSRCDVLIHGDVSPKNIMIKDGKPRLLDAECATMGDAAFDPAFCMNHLVLKAIHLPECRERYLQQATSFWSAYQPCVSWEALDALEQRVSMLLPMLMLARVDGKSPVEYLTACAADSTRQIARSLIVKPEHRMDRLIGLISRQLSDAKA